MESGKVGKGLRDSESDKTKTLRSIPLFVAVAKTVLVQRDSWMIPNQWKSQKIPTTLLNYDKFLCFIPQLTI